MKDVRYVKNIVSYYRQKLGKGCSSGKSIHPFEPNPEKSFNRGFTEYFLKGRTDCFNQESPKSRGEYLGEVVETGKKWIKLKTDKNISPQDGIYFNGDGFGVNKVEEQTNCITIYPNKPVNLKKGDKLWRNFDSEFEKELAKPVKRQIGVNIEFINNNLKITDENNITFNYPLPQGEKAKNPEKMKETFIKQFSKTGESDFYIENIKIQDELPFMPVSEINQLRREIFDRLMQKRLEKYEETHQLQKAMTYTKYYCDEVDYRANIHNKFAKEFYEKCGAKVLEPSFESKKPERKVAVMRCKHCIKYALNMCKTKTHLVLRDEFGKVYPLQFDCKNCEMIILN